MSGRLKFVTKTFELLIKSCTKFNFVIRELNIFNVQLHVNLKKWTLKLYLLLNHVSYFTTICQMHCV